MSRPLAIFDIECYRDYFLVCFIDIATGRRKHFEFYRAHPLDVHGIVKILHSHTVIGFNSQNYDIPMLRLALRMGVTNALLKQMGDEIIVNQAKPWHLDEPYKLPNLPFLDHIDLIEPAPSVKVGLKLYGARLHSKRLQDLPLDPGANIFDFESSVHETMVDYCWNDLAVTTDLFRHIQPQTELRVQMGKQYGVDLRSKSDAQIAETVIRHELERISGEKLVRPELPHDYSFEYQPPAFLSFKTPQLQEVFKTVCDATFRLKHTKAKATDDDAISIGGMKVKISGIAMPAEIKALKISIGNSTYKMGIGGLHSTESKVVHFSDEDYLLEDDDVGAYYPSLMLACGIYPDHLGPDFLDVYRKIKERRVEAKRTKDKVTDMTLKIVLNGTFGKLGSKWSVLYAPNLMLQVTITGQLALLMLIEELELVGIPVVSANTDGIVSKCRRDSLDVRRAVIKAWEEKTGFEMEAAEYDALYSRDVNNYLAVKPDGSVKQKGAFAFVGSKGSPAEKNPTNYVCIDAVIAYLTKGTPLMETIEWCPDIRRFLSVRRVTGGALYEGEYLGKVVRWYRAKGSKACIHYATNGNKVPKSDGAKPLMEMTGELPSDIDYEYYYNESVGMLGDLGVL